jgi:hypothetical protein
MSHLPPDPERLAGLCAALVPAARGMPAYAEADPGGALLRRAAALLPMHWATLCRHIGALPPAPSAVDILAFEHAKPDAFGLMLELVLAAYYLSPDVRARLGYDGQQAQSLPRDGFGAEELALAMMDSPPLWRDPR